MKCCILLSVAMVHLVTLSMCCRHSLHGNSESHTNDLQSQSNRETFDGFSIEENYINLVKRSTKQRGKGLYIYENISIQASHFSNGINIVPSDVTSSYPEIEDVQNDTGRIEKSQEPSKLIENESLFKTKDNINDQLQATRRWDDHNQEVLRSVTSSNHTIAAAEEPFSPKNPFRTKRGADISVLYSNSKKITTGDIFSHTEDAEKKSLYKITSQPQLHLKTSVGLPRKGRRMVAPESKLAVEYRECGYVFCYAGQFHLNQSVHRWDYHVDWKFPREFHDLNFQDRIFVLGDHFQMAHAYLVFRDFDRSFEGRYTCRLTLFDQVIHLIGVVLEFSPRLSNKQCVPNS